MKDSVILITVITFTVMFGIHFTKFIDEVNSKKNLPETEIIHYGSGEYEVIGYSKEQMDLLWQEWDKGIHSQIVRNEPKTIKMVKGNIILKHQ